MNKARGQKKDITRTLKAMKLEESAAQYLQTIQVDRDELHSISTKPAQPRIYASNQNKSNGSRDTKRRKFRYGRVSTEN